MIALFKVIAFLWQLVKFTRLCLLPIQQHGETTIGACWAGLTLNDDDDIDDDDDYDDDYDKRRKKTQNIHNNA